MRRHPLLDQPLALVSFCLGDALVAPGPGSPRWAARHASSGGASLQSTGEPGSGGGHPLQSTYRARGLQRKPELEPAGKRRRETDAEPARVEVRYFL